MKSSKLYYRPEVDGLRALAILSVIIYHAQIVLYEKSLFKGGFIGVDIFFVISGYLITRIIFQELFIKNSFNFINFYERRARRILPMLFVVIFVSIPFAWHRLFPSDFVEYIDSVLSSIFFVSNFFFYFNATEYDASSSLLKPFLHTWSLGIEEQFYLVCPIFSIFIFKYFRKNILKILIIISISSILFANFLEIKNSTLNFYFPLSRFWELTVGSIIAYIEFNYKITKYRILNNILQSLGLFLILFSIIYFNEKTPHPGFYSLMPILGVALIITFSTKKDGNGLVKKILSSRPFVWLGLISYSAYLWHFPIFAFSRINSSEPINSYKIILIIFTIFISALSYHFIEKPFKDKKLLKKKYFVSIIILSFVTLVSFSFISKKSEGFSERYPTKGWVNFQLDKNIMKKDFWKYYDENKKSLSEPSFKKVNVYIFGNSHSGDFLGALFNEIDFYKDFHFLKSKKREELSCFDESDLRFTADRKDLYDHEAYKKAEIFIVSSRFINGQCNKKFKDNPTDADGLRYLIPRLKRDGKKIIILGNTLVLNRIEGKWLEDYIFMKAINEKIDLLSFDEFKNYKKIAEKKAYELQADFNIKTNIRLNNFSLNNGLGYFERSNLFCNSRKENCLVFTKNGHRLRYDYGHLTLEGKREFGKLLKESNFRSILYDVLENQNSANSKYFPFLGVVNK